VFPALGIQKPLPLNTDMAIELPPHLRKVTFQCGMGMHRARVVAVDRNAYGSRRMRLSSAPSFSPSFAALAMLLPAEPRQSPTTFVG